VVLSSAPVDEQLIGDQPAAEESLEQDSLAMDQQLADSLFFSHDESLGEADIQLAPPIVASSPPPTT
jgi:hypothetical protein